MKEGQVVLVVDDEEINRKILKKILMNHYDIREAENGQQAWEMIQTNKKKIGAVLLDLNMPVMSGYDLLIKIHEAHLDELPVIVMTVSNDKETEQKALDAGAWDFVSKPYHSTILVSRLRNAIARSQISPYEKLRYISEHDDLTGFNNRSSFMSETENMIENHPNKNFVLLRLDIDHFAMFNTSFGVDEGDRLLLYISKNIEILVRKYELATIGRIGADIFCVCAPYAGDAENILNCAKQMQTILSAFRNDYRLEISIGACEIYRPLASMEEYYVRASLAAQKCKNQIDTHLAFYDNATGRKVAAENEITNEMQRALEERQFTVYLQPKFSLPSETPCGGEALVRWIHPIKGMVSPGEFIPVFEKNGFIAKLDYYVWEETCRMIRSWIDSGKNPYPISVNISRISLYNPNLAKRMTKLVEKYNLSPSLLQLEITESAYMTNPELMEETIEHLHLAGFTILMDDFGSGYSSLNTLKKIRVDVLKIDMKFLALQEEVERGEIILSSIIKMARWLGMTVIVEGVETRHQRDFVEGVGCDCIQGFYYAKPVPQHEYEEHYMERVVANQETISDVVPLHNVEILVIDDSPVDAMVLSNCLNKTYHVQCVTSAEQGLSYLKKNKRRVDLILVDNQMDGMSGIEFLRHCKQDEELRHIPKMMITASDAVEDQVAAFTEGAYDYIMKPFIVEVVTARVKHVMDISYIGSSYESTDMEYQSAAKLDSQTGLLNKQAFYEYGTKVMESNPVGEAALLVIDIDDFKKVNDRYGHLEGDKVIECVAKVLTNAFRKTDFIARFGGDEFVVLITKMYSQDKAKQTAMEIIKEVVVKCRRHLHISTSISVGISMSSDGDTMDTLFARADHALYQVKNSEKGRYAVYGEEVLPIVEDEKPIVLICGDDPKVYPDIALSYGTDVAFAGVNSFRKLNDLFVRYQNRICVVCLDVEKKMVEDAKLFYQYIIDRGGGTKIPIIAIYREGNMEQLKEAVSLDIFDVIALPPQNDIVQQVLTRAIMEGTANE